MWCNGYLKGLKDVSPSDLSFDLRLCTMTAWLVILSGLTCLIVWSSRKFKSKNNPPLPPGPPGEPLIGHLRLIPPDDQPMQFYKLGKTYGNRSIDYTFSSKSHRL